MKIGIMSIHLKHFGGETRPIVLLCYTSALDGMNSQLHARPLTPVKNSISTHWAKKWMGRTAGRFGEAKKWMGCCEN